MFNLIDFITQSNHINIYSNENGYWISGDEWDKAIFDLDGTEPDGSFCDCLYNIAAGKLSKEIYKRTHAEYIRMVRTNSMRTYRWSVLLKAYYDTITKMLI